MAKDNSHLETERTISGKQDSRNWCYCNVGVINYLVFN